MNRDKITGVILAGGLARRMGHIDKGLLQFRGKSMIAHVIERLAPQVDSLMLNANQNHSAYMALGYPVISDAVSNFAGPLAGLHAALSACNTPLLVSAPCDSPFLPADLVAMLRTGLDRDQAQIAVPLCGGRRQLVSALCRREVLDSLTRYLDAGGHKVDSWYATLKVTEVPFADQADFANINTLEELERLEST
ncbi:MAG: molybdenum cofactor guanylyltransferase [Betaproteobacteria bacterium]|nr:molybdenum cofactor guanylyltransferase [Betaproteobacteria bacterium]